jgi:hypothetical protein
MPDNRLTRRERPALTRAALSGPVCGDATTDDGPTSGSS